MTEVREAYDRYIDDAKTNRPVHQIAWRLSESKIWL